MSRPSSARAKTAAERIRQPTEIRRRMIVIAARSVIAERGLIATTIRDIASAAGVSLGTLTYHFSGIAEILGAVLQEEMDSFYGPIAEKARASETAIGAMRTIAEGFFSADERTVQHWRLWFDFWALSAHDEVYAQWQREAYTRWQQDMQQILERGRAEGIYEIRDLKTAMRDFLAMFDGLAAQAYLPSSPMGPARARKHLLEWINRNFAAPLPRTRTTTRRTTQ